MLGALALKWRWRARRQAAGKPADKPNLVTGANVQVCWEKFCRYWDVEPRLVPVEGDRLHLTGEEAVKLLRREHHRRGGGARDRRSTAATNRSRRSPPPWIGWSTTPGSTSPCTSTRHPAASWRRSSSPSWNGTSGFPGSSRSTPQATSTGWSTPASGGRSGAAPRLCPEELIFDVNYLGGHMPTFSLNFSRPGSEVVAQYYMFTSLGFEGYRRVQQRVFRHRPVPGRPASPASARTRLISDGSQLPVFSFALKPEVTKYTVFDVSDRLRERGWLVPAYTYPREPGGPGGAAHRGAVRHELRHGRPPARRPAPAHRRPGIARPAAAATAPPAGTRRSPTET